MSVIKAIKEAEKMAQIRKWDKTFWFFDIHSTILKPNYEVDNISKEFYPYAKETLQLLSKRDDICMAIYTCSHPHEIVEYMELFKSNDIKFEMINENTEVKTQYKGYGNYEKKPYMNVLFEDKSGFSGETDWALVYLYLTTGLAIGDTVEFVNEEDSLGKIININTVGFNWFPFQVHIIHSILHDKNTVMEFKESQIKKIEDHGV